MNLGEVPVNPEKDWNQVRVDMVQNQLRARGIKDERLLRVMEIVPRHQFVPDALQDCAYEDHPIHIGCEQTISQPYMVAAMTELLELQPEDRVLEIGTGSGYQTAILAELASEVISIERHEALAEQARNMLEKCNYNNIQIKVGDGTLGYPEGAPYDAIIITAGAPSIPQVLKEQLAIGGRLVCPVGNRELQHLVTLKRLEDGSMMEQLGMKCIFVPLLGVAGWQSES